MSYLQTYLNLPKLTVRESAGETITSPKEIYKHLKHTSELAQETATVITLDTRNRMIDTHIISIGTLNSVTLHPRDIFRAAIADNAARIIISHNHPSGDTTPSTEDIQITKKIVEAGKIMGIPAQDHVIIGRPTPRVSGFFSLREAGLVTFS